VKRLIQIYKSPRKDEMYLFVDRADELKRVPETLLAQFGTPQSVMVIAMTETRKLARADAAEVLAQIEEAGYYLQMPPPKESEANALGDKLAEYCAKFDQDPES